MDISGKECARARESVSADLDRELHELDLRRLKAHLRVCADCSVWAEQVTVTTAQLREAVFEPSPAAVFDSRRRGRTWRIGAAIAVAPAAALAASVVFSLGVAHGFVGGHRTSSAPLGPTDRHFVHDNRSLNLYGLPMLHGTFRAI
jgi:predicted anti-sigma-YlaC factor YlaD